jgi:hypothetical protein
MTGNERDDLLRETHRLNYELGYVGFRHQYFDDPETIAEWPDPTMRERELRKFWDGVEAGGFASYREKHANERVEVLTGYRDYLRSLLAGDEEGQIAYYDRITAGGRHDRLQQSAGAGKEVNSDDELRLGREFGQERTGQAGEQPDRQSPPATSGETSLGANLDASVRDLGFVASASEAVSSQAAIAPEISEDRRRADLIVEFVERIATWRKEDVASKWVKMSEEDKLRGIYWESNTVPDGAATLAAIEANVDYAGLPAFQREMLRDLRGRLDAGEFDGSQAENPDPASTDLLRIVDTGFFEQSLRIAKQNKDGAWAKTPDDQKVGRLIEMARESGAWTDWDGYGSTAGAYVLAAIEREVDYAKLSPWRRDGLQRLRRELDGAGGAGNSPYATDEKDRFGTALRTAEFEATIQDYKHFGDMVDRPVRLPWTELTMEEKLARVNRAIGDLGLDGESKPVEIISREVDLARVPEHRHVQAVLNSQDEARERGETERLAGKPIILAAGERADSLHLIVPYSNDGHPIDPMAEPCSVEDAEFFRLISYVSDRQSSFLAGLGDFPTLAEARAFVNRNTSFQSEGVLLEGDAYELLLEERDQRNRRSEVQIMDERKDVPTPQEYRKPKAEPEQDHGSRRLKDRGVKYEDQSPRRLDYNAQGNPKAGEQRQSPRPSPGDLASDDSGPAQSQNTNHNQRQKHGVKI